MYPVLQSSRLDEGVYIPSPINTYIFVPHTNVEFLSFETFQSPNPLVRQKEDCKGPFDNRW